MTSRLTGMLKSLSNATIALLVLGGVVAVEILGYIAMMLLDGPVPPEYGALVYTSLTILAGVAGAQKLNGVIRGK